MKWPRASGVLVHPTSFPGRFGIGDLGPGAIAALDFLAAARQRVWQVLPLGPTGYGDSPYALLSAFAGNPLLISPEWLLNEGWLRPADLAPLPPFPAKRVDYEQVVPWKMRLLRASFERFRATASPPFMEAFAAFREEHRAWLENYALFRALKSTHGDVAWTHWPEPYARRHPAALAAARQALADEVAFHQYTQFLFYRQWARVRQAAHQRGIRILGDLAIFVAHDSADVWAHPTFFALEPNGQPAVVAGVPPDYFSATGQRWGNPLYRWDTLARTGYDWWIERVRQARALVDIIRLDHFRGFEAYWEIPGSATTAERGRWVKGPGAALFSAIRDALGAVPMIAEDLGVITPEVRALQHEVGFPGMRVLQFAFGSDATSRDLPHNYARASVVYTGTHDNDTTRGWFDACSPEVQEHVLGYLHTTPKQVVWAMIRAALASVARLSVVPLQDVLQLGSEARMNTPARLSGNWAWRYTEAQLAPTTAERLAEVTTLYGRARTTP
ncbi:MAG: 4-alpha-glucanotransferase [Ktedonobacterales bacterium]|nr:4-alpha-glucanotransferase [Ktedonobacterales bacterium]